MDFLKGLLNVLLLLIVIFLLFFTTQPFMIYDQIGTVKFDDETNNTNDELNNKELVRRYIVPENKYSVYENMGIAEFNSIFNSVTFKLNNISYTFDLINDLEKIILPLIISYPN